MKVKFVEPSAHLIASSLALGKNEVVEAWSNRYNSHFSTDGENRINSVYKAHGGDRERDEYVSAAKTVEYAGRGCYEAYSRKNSKTDSYEDYIYNILRNRHFSVLEHTSFTIELDGISRAATHEIVRHRHFSFSQESQRFVFKEDGLRMVVPPALVERLTDDEQRIYQQALNGDMFSIVSYAGSSDALQQIVKLKNLFAQTMMQANEMRDILKTNGATRKQASEAARALYPNCAATKIVVTGNARSWLEFISKRHSGAADAELQMIAELVWSILRYTMPEVFSDKPAELWLDEAEQKGGQK